MLGAVIGDLAGSLYETRNSTDGSEFIFFREIS